MTVEFTLHINTVRNPKPPFPYIGSIKIGNRTICEAFVAGNNLTDAAKNMESVFASRMERLLNE